MKARSMTLAGFVLGLAFKLVNLIPVWSKNGHRIPDPGTGLFLKIMGLAGENPLDSGKPIDQVRAASEKTAVFKKKPVDIADIREQTIPGPGGEILVRIYNSDSSKTVRPVVMYFHGGGWALGDLDSHDNVCRAIAQKTNMIVISTAYRLAPEHQYPAAVDDAYAALVWANENALSFNGNGSRIAVAGDSSGGNIAAVLSVMARDRGNTSLVSQVLIYPVVDLSSMDTASYRSFAQGYYLTKKSMEMFRSMYVPEQEKWTQPYVSPLKAHNLELLVPAFIVTAQFDILRDEAEAYASRLRDSGNQVRTRRYPGVVHGFVSLDRLTHLSDQALDDIAFFLKQTLG